MGLEAQTAVEAEVPAAEQTAPAVAETKEDFLSPKFAALAKKEKWLRQQAKAISDEKKDFESKLRAREEEVNNSWKKRLQENAFDVLQENGQTYDKLTESLLAKGDPVAQTIQELKREIAELKGAQESTLNKFSETEKAQYEQAKKQIRSDVVSAVDTGEEYEAIKADGSYDAVVDLIEETYNATGSVMSVEEACKEVEDYLVDHYFKFTNLKKIQAKLKPPVAEGLEEVTPAQKQIPNPTQKHQTTLSNRMVPSAKTLTQEERRQRAILAFQGKLQS